MRLISAAVAHEGMAPIAMPRSTTTYSMSFTTATLLYRESLVVAGLYAELGDRQRTRTLVVEENRLQMRTDNASRRICSEVISRLRLLTSSQLGLLLDGDQQERRYLLWLAVCKRYRFIYDFAAAVLHEKYYRLETTLEPLDYDVFFNATAEWHPEVTQIAASTRRKQRQFVFKMLREADLLTDDHRIIPALLSPSLIRAIGRAEPADFAIFPAPIPTPKEWLA